MKVGQKVYWYKHERGRNRKPVIKETTITKIGRKYIHVDLQNDNQFCKERLKHLRNNYGYNSNIEIFLSREHMESELKNRKYIARIKNIVGSWDFKPSLDVSTKILKLIQERVENGQTNYY